MSILEAFKTRRVFVIGGQSVYAELMPFCSEFHLTYIKEHHDGDAVMPPFEQQFAGYHVEEVSPQYEFRHYLRNAPKNFVRTGSISEHC